MSQRIELNEVRRGPGSVPGRCERVGDSLSAKRIRNCVNPTDGIRRPCRLPHAAQQLCKVASCHSLNLRLLPIVVVARFPFLTSKP